MPDDGRLPGGRPRPDRQIQLARDSADLAWTPPSSPSSGELRASRIWWQSLSLPRLGAQAPPLDPASSRLAKARRTSGELKRGPSPAQFTESGGRAWARLHWEPKFHHQIWRARGSSKPGEPLVRPEPRAARRIWWALSFALGRRGSALPDLARPELARLEQAQLR